MRSSGMCSPVASVERRILPIRGQRVMLDADLAALYGVSTRVLNQAVKRNRQRFPEDFMFRLTAAEKAEVITTFDHLRFLYLGIPPMSPPDTPRAHPDRRGSTQNAAYPCLTIVDNFRGRGGGTEAMPKRRPDSVRGERRIAHHRESDGATQSLAAHLLGVAAHASSFAKKIGLADQGELIGLLHDLGKYSNEFQNYLKSAVGLLNQDEDEEFVDARGLKGKVDHSTAGAQLVWRELSKQGPWGQIVGQVLVLCIASHHSGLIDCLTSDMNSLGEDAFGRRLSKPVERSHLREALAKADEQILSHAREILSHPEMLTAVQEVMARIVSFAPGKHDKSVVAQQQFGLLVRFLFSCLIDADRIDSADFEKPGSSAESVGSVRLG